MENLRFTWPGGQGFGLEVADFVVARGEKLLLTGPSGCGKSTLLGLICAINQPQSGRIEVSGQDIARLGGAARDRFRADHFGIIFQLFNLLPYVSVLDNVLLPLSFARERRIRAEAAGGARAEARRILSRLGLEQSADERAGNLSVGQQQRAAVARALIGRPAIIVADEPTSALDRDRQAAFLALLFEEAARAGSTLIMVSHDQSLAPRFDRAQEFGDFARTHTAGAP